MASSASGGPTNIAADTLLAAKQSKRRIILAIAGTASTDFPPLLTRGARQLRLPSVLDPRGSLAWGQFGAHLPFLPRRFWSIHGVSPGQTRGNHGHRNVHEFLVCVHGSCSVTLDDGVARDEVVLDAPDLGLYVPPLTWTTQHRFSADAVLLVLASELYRPDDYVRDYNEFLALARSR